ncbi:MAG: tryptophan-rich sensory protein [Acidisphaera sp.]|nr:tryptophan-rich sensory protein [Acidisphaera sp.]
MILPFVIAGLGAIATAVAGALLTKLGAWYRDLRKPSWQPPDWLFGPAWTVIFALAAYAAGAGWESAPDEATRTTIVGLFVANALLNMFWSWLFFTRQRPDWALVEVAALWLSIFALIVVLAPVSAPLSTPASLAMVPYLLWVSFASFLNLTIVRLNRPFGAVRASRA